jgi:phenylacetate-CoA ligase
MVVIRGVIVYPASIHAVLSDIEQEEPRYQVVLYREGSMDQIEVQIEVEPSFLPDAVRKLQGFQHHVEERLRQELGIRPRVRLVEPKTIPAAAGEKPRVMDRRGV